MAENKQILILAILGVLAVLVGFYFYQQSSQKVGDAPANAVLSVVLGENSKAPKMVVYTDLLCDRCHEYHNDTLSKLKKDYVDQGKLQLEIRPVAIVSERSASLTELVMCTNEQQAFWPGLNYIYNALYTDEKKTAEQKAGTFFDDHSFKAIADKLSINEKKLANCKNERTYDEKIAKADKDAGEADIYSTPTTFIKDTEPVRGYARYDFIRSLVDDF